MHPQQPSCNAANSAGDTACDKAGRRNRGRNRERGSSIIETSFLVPWIFFLFVGVLDVGFYCYALMAVSNAARIAVLQTSASRDTYSDSSAACSYALPELQNLPNLFGATTCLSSGTVSQGAPLLVTATEPPPDGVGSTACVASSSGGPCYSSLVTVTYFSLPLIPIPGLLTGQITITRTAPLIVG